MESNITVAGNVGARIEWKEIGPTGGRAVFSLACTPRVKKQGEWVDGSTTWYRVTCWRRLAENVRDSVGKGDAVVVGGRLSSQRWRTTSGEEREEFQIEAQWIGHDLRLGTTAYTRAPARVVPETPQFESDFEAERYEAEQLEVEPFGAEAADPVVVPAA